MENKIEIKAVEAHELSVLVQMSRDTFIHNYAHLNEPVFFQQHLDKAFDPHRIQSEWADPLNRFFWVMVNDERAGYCKLILESPIHGLEAAGKQVLEVQRIYVLEPYQKLGLGKQMLLKANAIAEENGCQWVWLGVWENNHKAIAWYQGQGFEHFAEHTFWMGDDPQRDWLMRKMVGKQEGLRSA